VSVLAVTGLTKRFGAVRAVDGIAFDVRAGELVAMIGPNGAGKTTCFNMLNGQLSPDAGVIRLGNDEIQGRTPREICRMGVGRTFQVAATFPSMSVRENVQMALIARHRRIADPWTRAAALYRDAAEALLERVGMLEQAARPCAVLAYGDLKRAELAVALAGEPRLLLMDEPTAGMAPRERGALMALAVSVVRERDIAVLFTEHDMDVVFRHADRILVLDRGGLIAQGAPVDVRADPEVQRIYLGSVA
jgi:branched-chain amino acid transport system ATP-binding protein